MADVTFDATPTLRDFMLDNSLVRALLGPVGSGKTTGMAIECARRMCEEAPDSNGVRKTRVAVIRNTAPQLRQTVLPEIEKWLRPAYKYRISDKELFFNFTMPDGTRVESEWMLIPLDRPEDVQRLLSLNLSFAWVSEFREVHTDIIESLLGRVGRYKSIGVAASKYYGVMMESNMPNEDSPWYTKLELELPSTWKVFKQPGGTDPKAENIKNLRPNYYEDLLASNTAEWSKVYVHAEYGTGLSGQAVFRASFNPDFHLSKEPLLVTSSRPLMVGQDFGRTPAALIAQVDVRGRLIISRELTSEDMGIEQFATSLLRPTLLQHYGGHPLFITADPSGRDKSQTNEDSPFDVLKRLGFQVYPAATNKLEPRLRGVEQLLLRQVDGGPALMIDEANCPLLTKALKSMYRYRRKKNNELEDKPEKTHPWSDLADCLQYLALATTGNYTAKVIQKSRARPEKQVSAVGWT